MRQGGTITSPALAQPLQQSLAWMLRRPYGVLLVVAMVSAVFAWKLPQLSFRTSLYDLVIEDLPATARYEAFRRTFGSDEIIRVVIKCRDVFDPLTFRHIADISRQVGEVPGVRRVIGLPAIKQAVEISGKWDLPRFKAAIRPLALLRKNLLSDDHRVTVLNVVLKTGADKQNVIDRVDRIISRAPEGLRLYQIGMPLVALALARYSQKDLFRLPPITLAVIGVVLWLAFRRLCCLAAPLVCVLVCLCWTFGLMAWTGVAVSMLTMIVPVFLIAVGIAYCLHILSAYLAATGYAASRAQAVQQAYRHVTLPTFLAVLTTVAGLASLLINRIAATREFALFACFGMLSLLVLLLTLLPVLLCVLPAPRADGRGETLIRRRLNRLIDAVVTLNLRHRRRVFYAVGAVTLLCLAGMPFIRVETNPVGFFRDNTPISRHFSDIHRHLSGCFPVNVVVQAPVEDFFESPENIAVLSKLGRFAETLPGVDKSVSFADYLKLVNYATNRYRSEYYRLPEEAFEVRMAVNSYKSLLGQDMLERFVNPDFSRANILLFTHIASSRGFLDLKKKILAHVNSAYAGQGLRWEVTGFGVVISASSQLLTRGQAKSFSLTLLIIFVVMLLLFLSVRVGLIAILPNLFPLVVNFGLMGWLGIHLSVVTSLIASVAIGLAVDDTIHYLFCYNREFKKDLNKDRAMADTIRQVGQPIVMTSLTICLGFAVLVFSSFKPTAVFGLLMVITMAAAMIGDLLILPALMLRVELVTAWDMLRVMPTLGGLSDDIVHDLNQPLNVIRMGSDYLKMMVQRNQPVRSEDLREIATEIGEQVDRTTRVIAALAALGQKSGFELRSVDLNSAVRDAVALLGHQLTLENIRVKIQTDESLPPVRAQKARMAEVVFNLLENAREAVAAGRRATGDTATPGDVTIRTYTEGGWICVAVSDNGIGMPGHVKARIFEPFFSTRKDAGAKGLGLTACRQVVQACGGEIVVESAEGRGTTVTLCFPAAAPESL